MGHAGGTGGAGGGADACLIGEQAALDALHQSGTHKAAEDGLEVKGVAEDAGKHGGNEGDVGEDHKEGDSQVQHAHHRHQHGGDVGNLLAAAADANQEHHGQHNAHDPGGEGGIIEAVSLEGVGNIEGGHQVKAHHVGEYHHHGEENAQPALLESLLDVVGGAAVAAAVLGTLLINLSQSTFHKGGGAAQQGGDPHPEHRAGAAQADGGGDAGDVAGTHAGGGGDHQGLEGGDAVLVLAGLHDDADRFGQEPELDELGAHGKVDAASHQQDNENVGIEIVADAADETAVCGCDGL